MGTDFGRYFGEYLSVGTLHFRVSAGDHKEMDPPLCKAKFEVYQGAFGSTDWTDTTWVTTRPSPIYNRHDSSLR